MPRYRRGHRYGWLSGITAGGIDPTVTLREDLMAYWKLDEASGTRFDSTASDQDLTDNNTVGTAAGKLHPLAAQFIIGNVEYLSHADSAILDVGDIDFTWAGWFYTDAALVDQYILSKGAAVIDYEIFVNVDSVLFRWWNGSYSTAFSSALSAPAGQWHHFIAWHDSLASTINLQLNNGTVLSFAAGSNPPVGTQAFAIGYRVATGGNHFGGRIADVCFWKRILTPYERDALWNNGNGITLY